MHFIKAIEAALGQEANKNYMDLQPGDVPATYADVDDLVRDVGFKPETTIADGIGRFVEWYQDYYGNRSQKTWLGSRVQGVEGSSETDKMNKDIQKSE